VRHLRDRRYAVDDHVFVAPVELLGLTRRERQRRACLAAIARRRRTHWGRCPEAFRE
jgi:hypothetical protein